jgi:hypothetical protein
MDYGLTGMFLFGRRETAQTMTLQIGGIGMEGDNHGDKDMITDVLDLVRSVILGDNPQQAVELMFSLVDGGPVAANAMTDGPAYDHDLGGSSIAFNWGCYVAFEHKTHHIRNKLPFSLLAIPNYSIASGYTPGLQRCYLGQMKFAGSPPLH